MCKLRDCSPRRRRGHLDANSRPRFHGGVIWDWEIHYSDVIMTTMASQITSCTIVYSTVYSGADQKHQGFAIMTFVMVIYRSLVNSAYQWSVTRKSVSIWWRHHFWSVYEAGIWPVSRMVQIFGRMTIYVLSVRPINCRGYMDYLLHATLAISYKDTRSAYKTLLLTCKCHKCWLCTVWTVWMLMLYRNEWNKRKKRRPPEKKSFSRVWSERTQKEDKQTLPIIDSW